MNQHSTPLGIPERESASWALGIIGPTADLPLFRRRHRRARAVAKEGANPFKPVLARFERASTAAIRSAQHPAPTLNPTGSLPPSHRQRRSNPHKPRAASRGSGLELSATPAPSAPAPSCKGGRRRNLNMPRRSCDFTERQGRSSPAVQVHGCGAARVAGDRERSRPISAP